MSIDTVAQDTLLLDTLRAAVLDQANALVGQLRMLHDAAPGGTPQDPFASAAAIATHDNLLRAEKAERIAQRAAGYRYDPIGFSAAPGAVRALDALASCRATLLVVRRSALEETPVCRISTTAWQVVPGRVDVDQCHITFVAPTVTHRTVGPIDPTDAQLLATIAGLAQDIADPDWHTWALEELDSVARTTTRALDDVSAAPFPALCPHCDRPTLVRHKDEGVIRCEGDRNTGRKERCVCGHPDCGCAHGQRHEWEQGLSNGWHRLAGEIRHADNTRPTTRRTRP